MDENIQCRIKDKISEIEKKSANGAYIYRGEPEDYGKVSSSLWREYGLETDGFDIETIQSEMLNDAKKHIGDLSQDFSTDTVASIVNQPDTDETINFEILTEIQHYGGQTNLIDFTTDCFIALFFACDGYHNEPGRVILQKIEDIKEMIKTTRNPRHRVIAQKSVFVHPPNGFIEPHKDNIVIIPPNLKQGILQYLRKYHGISTEAIYNDLHGFIRHQDIHGGAYTEFYRGFASLKRGDEAKTRKKRKKWFKKAVKDFTQAIRLDPNQATTYVNRSIAHIRLKDYSSAIKDCDRAIAINPNYLDAYNNRGRAYLGQNDLGRAIEEYCRAIALNPNDAHAYFNRGVALLYIVEIEGEGAKEDLITAKEKGLDIIAAFRAEYGSVEDFEDRIMDLPADIVEMLTPTWPEMVT
ncbi:tetratricopeptide repeat protein [Candidatus Poribacteria bacterium]|nr:tetratricopeptide repeat protein [Candidatus Poribacteria bacterium]